MIRVVPAQSGLRAFDAAVLFARRLGQAGHAASVPEACLPEGLERSGKYDAAPVLAAADAADASHVLLLGAEAAEAEALVHLPAIAGAAPITALGRFGDHQTLVQAQTRIAYATGREPGVLNTADLAPRAFLPAGLLPPAGLDLGLAPDGETQLLVYLPVEALDDALTLPVLGAMDRMGGFRLSVVIAGKGQDLIRRSRFSALSVYGYAELPPQVLAARTGIAAFFGEAVPGDRMAALALDLLTSGRVVIDGTGPAAFAATGAPVLRGPTDVSALSAYLEATILPNLAALGAEARAHPWVTGQGLGRLTQTLGLAPAPQPAPKVAPRTWFMPTNGHGLGHARRTSLIAAHLENPVFAAFPSCLPMLEGAGLPALPLVSRSPDHPEDFAADIVNAQRLARWCGPGEKFVFDGGYVFDSVFRTITERGLDATWIRRGLWKPGQLTDVALEREKIFNRVIVPGEAFDELNDAYSFGPSVHRVGPIVADHRADRTALRAEIAKRAGRDFDRLVVTMLGGGAAPARAGIVQYLAALIAMRTNTLQIVVAWPGTRVPAGHFRWPNTVVARSRQALDLAVAADVTVSAAGYNSFHELLYHQVPAILVPQDAPFLDDQTARAEAAARRGLAAHVGETDLLELGRTLGGALDGALADEIRGALNEADLPARGTEAAAGLIAEGTP